MDKQDALTKMASSKKPEFNWRPDQTSMADAAGLEIDHFALNPGGIRQARDWLHSRLQAHAVAQDIRAAFAVCLSELAMNLHDHATSRPSDFEIRLQCQDSGIELGLAARCASFAGPEEFRLQLCQANDDPLSLRGRGMAIVRHYFPAAEYRPAAGEEAMEVFILRRGLL